MNAYERLLAEEIPTGTFGHAAPPPPGPRRWTAIEQAEHRRTLDEALDSWEWNRDERRTERRHLRLVDTHHTERPAA